MGLYGMQREKFTFFLSFEITWVQTERMEQKDSSNNGTERQS